MKGCHQKFLIGWGYSSNDGAKIWHAGIMNALNLERDVFHLTESSMFQQGVISPPHKCQLTYFIATAKLKSHALSSK